MQGAYHYHGYSPCSRSASAETVIGYAVDGFAPFIPEWQRRNAFRGKAAKIILPDGSTASGDVVGVDASGALVLDHRGRRLRFVTGEVSLRRP